MNIRWLAVAAGVALCAVPGLTYAQGGPSLWSNGIISTRSIWSGVYTNAQAARGEKAYHQQCVWCHMDFLEGDPSEGPPPLAGDHFMVNWDGLSLADLAHHMHTQPNDDPSDIDYTTATDLVAFILKFNNVPAGNTELPADRAIQAQIGFTAQKPGR